MFHQFSYYCVHQSFADLEVPLLFLSTIVTMSNLLVETCFANKEENGEMQAHRLWLTFSLTEAIQGPQTRAGVLFTPRL